jgi:hypothetical protein
MTRELQSGSPPPPPEMIEDEALHRLLDLAPHPLSASKVQAQWPGPSRPPLDRVEELLGWQVAAGKTYRYATPGSADPPRYWTRDPKELTRGVVLELLATRWLTLPELKRRLKSPLGGVPERLQLEVIRQLQREERLHQWPPLLGTRSPLYSCLTPHPEPYLMDALSRVAGKLSLSRAEIEQAALGMMTTSAAVASPPSSRPATSPPGNSVKQAQLLERMVQVKLATLGEGTPLLFFELWESLRGEGWEKPLFDQVILGLGHQDRFRLLPEEEPTQLSLDQRQSLVVDRDGNLYRGIQRR